MKTFMVIILLSGVAWAGPYEVVTDTTSTNCSADRGKTWTHCNYIRSKKTGDWYGYHCGAFREICEDDAYSLNKAHEERIRRKEINLDCIERGCSDENR